MSCFGETNVNNYNLDSMDYAHDIISQTTTYNCVSVLFESIFVVWFTLTRFFFTKNIASTKSPATHQQVSSRTRQQPHWTSSKTPRRTSLA